MTVTHLENLPGFGPRQPKLFKPDRLRDVLADTLARQHPKPGTRKAVGRRLKLNGDEARSAVEGSPSPTTLDKIWREGGWPLVIEVFGEFLGERLDQHLERERRRHDQMAEQIGEVVRDFRSAVASGRGDRAGDHLRLAGERGAERGDLGARSSARTRTRD